MSKSVLNRVVGRINAMPEQLRSPALTGLFGRAVKFAGTSRVRVVSLTEYEAVMKLKNRSRVQNHVGSIHAAAMALLAESASGFLISMNVPDSRAPVLKSLRADYSRRASGDLLAVANLTADQVEQIRTREKGEVDVAVRITDSQGLEPLVCNLVWGWTPKVKPRDESA